MYLSITQKFTTDKTDVKIIGFAVRDAAGEIRKMGPEFHIRGDCLRKTPHAKSPVPFFVRTLQRIMMQDGKIVVWF